MSDLPTKLNPIILPLMAAIKREEEEILQHRAAEALAELIFTCIGRKPSLNDKLIKNLCNLTWSDLSVTPQAGIVTSMDVIEDQNLLNIGNTTSSRRAKIKIQSSDEDRSKMDGFISRRGSELALQLLCEKFGSSLFDKLPKLWDCLTEILKLENLTDDQTLIRIADSFKERDPQALINNIQALVEEEEEEQKLELALWYVLLQKKLFGQQNI